MENLLAAVFDNEIKAREGLSALDALGESYTIGLNASAVVTKTRGGAITVVQGDQPIPDGALGGTAIGALIGMLGGPIGLTVGAAAGLALGASADGFGLKVEREFLAGVERALQPGKAAVVAQIYEEDTGHVNERMAALGGVVFRRELTDVADEQYREAVATIRRRFHKPREE